MNADLNRADVTLAELLRARAIRASARRLTLDIVVGAAFACICTWRQPSGWASLASGALCVCLYGVWAVAEQRVDASTWNTPVATVRAWRLLGVAAATLGLLSVLVLITSVVLFAMGTYFR